MALTLSILAGFCTLLGSLLVLIIGTPRAKTLAFFLGLAAGVMGGVVVLDLLPASISMGGYKAVWGGTCAGLVCIAVLDTCLGRIIGYGQGFFKTGVLVALGIALHDLPEGLAIAAGFATTTYLGLVMALMIGLHNLPEGMATSVPLRAAGTAAWKIVVLNAFVSLVTPLGTLLGLWFTATGPFSLGVMSAAAAGAMAYIVIFELIPHAFQQHVPSAARGLLYGLAIVAATTLVP
ncbi:MAG: ZIP family metal transporter [Peptococcaceae bacterium]|nr:ZIP family metal transporter [Peptococcaceae bacterium]